MYFEVEDATFFKKVMECIGSIIDEGTIEASSDGLTLKSMDANQIAMISFSMPKEAFGKFEVEGNKKFSINLQDLLKIIGRAKGLLSIQLDDEASKLLVELKSDSTKTFKLPLLDLKHAAAPKEPTIPFDASVKIKADSLKELIKDASMLAAYITLEAKDSMFTIEAQGDSGELKTETKAGSPAISAFELKSEKARSMFSSEYLDKITKGAAGEEPVEVSLKTNAPIKVEYNIQKARLKYYLAPRVES